MLTLLKKTSHVLHCFVSCLTQLGPFVDSKHEQIEVGFKKKFYILFRVFKTLQQETNSCTVLQKGQVTEAFETIFSKCIDSIVDGTRGCVWQELVHTGSCSIWLFIFLLSTFFFLLHFQDKLQVGVYSVSARCTSSLHLSSTAFHPSGPEERWCSGEVSPWRPNHSNKLLHHWPHFSYLFCTLASDLSPWSLHTPHWWRDVWHDLDRHPVLHGSWGNQLVRDRFRVLINTIM